MVASLADKDRLSATVNGVSSRVVNDVKGRLGGSRYVVNQYFGRQALPSGQVQLPGYAEAVGDPAKLLAESVVTERHHGLTAID